MTSLTKQRYIVRLHLNDREIGRWILDDQPLKIGRTPDNDIVIDNLAVSRHHATIELSADGPRIVDQGSVNGLIVDGSQLGEQSVHDGLSVLVGKHTLSFEAEAGRGGDILPNDTGGFEATIQATATPRIANPAALIGEDDEKHPIDHAVFLLGKSDIADIRLDGMLIADFHAEIKVENGEHRISHVDGRRKVTVNGEKIAEHLLEDGDVIEIAGKCFRFQAAG